MMSHTKAEAFGRLSGEITRQAVAGLAAELAEARRLLGMATAFDAGPLLGDVPDTWTCGNLEPFDAREHARIEAWVRPDGEGWRVVTPASDNLLCRDGQWTDDLANAELWGFPTPTAALAALDAWRAARRAEIMGGSNSVAQTASEPTP